MPKLTKAQLGHIHSLLAHEREAGTYYGPKAQHAKRQADLLDIFACAEAGHLEVRWAPPRLRTAQSHGTRQTAQASCTEEDLACALCSLTNGGKTS